jgi:penicillin-binding protein 2
MSAEAHGHIVEGFRRVVQLPGGTAYGRGFAPEWNAAGKTGSAEVAGQELTNGWFVAFAPYDRPEFIAIALVEAEGHGGAAASPLVLALMAAHFNPALRPGGAVASEGAASEGAPPPSENLQPAEEEEVPFWARAR